MKYKAGFSSIQFICFSIILAFLSSFAFKLLPIYLESRTVQSILTHFENGQLSENAGYWDPTSIRKAFEKNLEINSVLHIDADQLSISPIENGYLLHLNYDRAVNLIPNWDLNIHFDKKATIHLPGVS